MNDNCPQRTRAGARRARKGFDVDGSERQLWPVFVLALRQTRRSRELAGAPYTTSRVQRKRVWTYYPLVNRFVCRAATIFYFDFSNAYSAFENLYDNAPNVSPVKP